MILPYQKASPFSEHLGKKSFSLGACRISLISPFSLLIEETSTHTITDTWVFSTTQLQKKCFPLYSFTE